MRVLFGYPGCGWKMYGLASFRKWRMWFVGFSKQLKSPGCFGSKPTHQEQAENDCHTCPSEDQCARRSV